MRRFSIFCVLVLQIILFAQPTVSERARGFINLDDLQSEDVLKLFDVTQPTKQCPEIELSLELARFLIVPCLDKSSKELDVTLKVGNIDLGHGKGTFDSEVVISFDHEQFLTGVHRYYLKENYLWLHYDNTVFGEKLTGDRKLSSVPSGFLSSADASKPKPKPKEDASKSKSRYDL